MLDNLLIPAVLFFALGFLAQLIKSDLRFPPDIGRALSIYLLIGIGLHGGLELAHAELSTALLAIIWALVLGIVLPIMSYFILFSIGHLDKLNAAAIAAHYGSVSAGTFLTALAFLDSRQISYETYPLIMLAIMESPAIIIGLILANLARRGQAQKQQQVWGELLHEALTNGSVVLLLGSIFIGYVAEPSALEKIKPFFDEIFMGVLCVFLLEMGLDAARRLNEFRRVGMFLIGFGLVMPLIGGSLGLLIGHYALGFSVGGTTLVAVLAASASYIAVPPAMRLAIPEANPSFYLTLSLGVTFPFNVLIGISLYFQAAQWLAG